MPREEFHKELERLSGDVVGLGHEVEACLERMVEAMAGHEDVRAERDLGVDVEYKTRGAEMDEECMILQARQAPVARDLRLIYSLQAVTNHVVRAGTLCEHIFQSLSETAYSERDEDIQVAILEMARAARDLFSSGLDIFEQRDIDRARDLQAEDDRVDLLYSEALNLVVSPAKPDTGSTDWRVRAALMVHYLERIADHGVDMGELAVFLVTGERMESAIRDYRRRGPENRA